MPLLFPWPIHCNNQNIVVYLVQSDYTVDRFTRSREGKNQTIRQVTTKVWVVLYHFCRLKSPFHIPHREWQHSQFTQSMA